MASVAATRAILALVGLLLPALLLEALFRLSGPIVPGNYETGVWAEGHPVLGHFHIPGARAWVREPEFTTYLRFNQHGLRGPEIPAQRTFSARRILLLGDSFLEAKQVPEQQALPDRLTAQLQERDAPAVRTLNAGTFDWSQVHEHLFLQLAGPTLQPDLVLQFIYVGNDIGDLWPRSRGELRDLERPLAQVDDDGQLHFLDWRRRTPGGGEALLGMLSRHSLLLRAFETGVVDKLRYGAAHRQGVEGQMMDVLRFKESASRVRAWKAVEALLVATRDEAERQGARFALVIVPSKWQIYDEDWESILATRNEPDDDRWVLRGPDRKLTQLAQAHQIPTLDLLPTFRRSANGGPRLYYPVDIHWTAAGHEVAARAVADFLLSNELLR